MGGPWQNVMNGMRWIMVNGKVYAFERSGGKLRWYAEVPHQILLVDQFKESPIMLFTARYNKPMNVGGGVNRAIQQVTATKTIDKRTGKLLFDREFQNNYAQQYYALTINPQEGTIDLVSYSMKIQHYLESGGNEKTSPSGRRSDLEPGLGARQGDSVRAAYAKAGRQSEVP
jgi:hypothetical protein